MKNHGGVLRAVAAAAAAGLVAALAAGATNASASPSAVRQAGPARTAAAPAPVLYWKACDGGFQCATARVPLDYRHRGGAKISIAVVRHLATVPARRLGSLFINGGGPGEQIEGLAGFYPSLPAVMRERFDIVFFDPRGFGWPTPARADSERHSSGAASPAPSGQAMAPGTGTRARGTATPPARSS